MGGVRERLACACVGGGVRKCVRSGQRAQREVEFFPRCGVGGGDRASFTSTCTERVGGSELNGEELLLKQWVLERLRCLDRAPFPELWCWCATDILSFRVRFVCVVSTQEK